MPRRLSCALLLAGLLGAACKPSTPTPPPPPPPSVAEVDFSTEIRPLLARQCLTCHGPLDLANSSGVRLDSREEATRRRPLSGAQPVFPGDPSRSALLQKLFTVSPDDPATPTDQAHTVTTAEHELLARWIEQGAYYEPHWAFQPLPEEVPLPPSPSSLWPRAPFDQFTLAGLGDRPPRPPVAPLAWLHRAAIDLTGLPPEPDVVEEFERNLRENSERTALETAVDQLLASPAYGEHLATRWLQVARYTDLLAPGHPSTQQAYRNWVVRSFNDNLPYDRFLTLQVAGDLVDPATDQSLVATGFLRLHPLPEASDQPVEDSTARRTESFARAMLGLEFHCARCHHHPLDPLGPEDHLSLQAFFGGTGETGRRPAPGVTPTPSHLLLDAALGDELHTHTQAEADTMQAIDRARAEGEERFGAWLAAPDQLPLISDLIAAHSFDQGGDRSPNTALGGGGAAVTGTLPAVEGLRGQALELDGTQAIGFPDLPPLTRSEAFTITFWLQLPALPDTPAILLSRTGDLSRGLELRLEDGHLAARIYREWPGNGIGVRTAAPVLTAGTWHQIAWSYDGTSTAEGLRLLVDGRPATTETTANHLWKSAATPDAPLLLGGHPSLTGALLDDVQVFARALTTPEIAHLHDGRTLAGAIAAGDREGLADYYFSSIDPPVRAHARELPVHRRALVEAEDRLTELAVMHRATEPERTPATPSFLPPLAPAAGGPDRLDLARWLTDPAHPLTARLFVNRLWENFLGAPLVAGVDDLGTGSSAPADRELLDWLARDFVNHGWDVKDLCRRIVLSATYRQSQPLALDPLRFRDRALAAAGLLWSPEQPTPFSRSLYQRWPIPAPSSPHPCPGSEPPPARGTPASPVPQPFSEAERAALLDRIVGRLENGAPAHDAGRLAFLFRSLTGREPTVNELGSLGELAREQKTATPPGQSPWPDIAARLLEQDGHETLRHK